MFLFLKEGCMVKMVLHRAALFALKKHEVALRAFYCLLIDYSSLERSEALAEVGLYLKCWKECAVRPEEMAQGISLHGFSFASPVLRWACGDRFASVRSTQ